MRATLLAAALCAGCAAFAGRQGAAEVPLRGPNLAAASNFGHGWDEETFRAAIRLGVRDFRDIVYWSAVEADPGIYRFDGVRASYPDRIGAEGARMSLTVNWGNALYDEGDTPHSPEALAALGRFVAATLGRHPAIDAVEVGNEFNGANFVTGPVRRTRGAARAESHLALLGAVHHAVEALDPEIEVLGGAAHSVPGGYLWPLLDRGGAALMDALAIHPYGTPPEQLARQVEVLRRHEAALGLPLQVTEFGHKDADGAAGYLLRMYCAMALSGTERAAWYPLNARGDGFAPLIDPDAGAATDAGRAYMLAVRRLAGRPVANVAPDPYTHACRFGEDTLVIWGEPRALALAPGASAADAAGTPLDAALGLALSPEDPLVITLGEGMSAAEALRLGPLSILADSFHQFAYPREGEARAAGDPFERLARRRGREIPLRTMPGQDAAGVPWVPYLGAPGIRPARLSAETLVPGGRGDGAVEIVHRYVPDRSGTLAVEGSWTPTERSADGIEVAVSLDGVPLHRSSGHGPHRFAHSGLRVEAGSVLEFAVGPGGDARGDVTSYRIAIRAAE